MVVVPICPERKIMGPVRTAGENGKFPSAAT
jgi:hypothetical protein